MTAPSIRVIDADFSLFGEIDIYSSLTLTRGYDTPGNFEAVLPLTHAITESIAPGRFILADGFCGMIERLLFSASDEGETLTISGQEASGMLRYRICMPPEGETHATASGSIGECIAQMVTQQAIAPTDARRALPITLGAIEPGDIEGEIKSRYGVLSEVISEAAQSAGLGWRITPDLEAQRWMLEVYKGCDLTTEQAALGAVIFSPQLDNLRASSYEWATADTYDRAIVAGQGEGVERQIVIVDSTSSGIKLRETFVDARDLSDIDALLQRGRDKLRAEAPVESFEGTVMARENERWQLGDRVTIRHDGWGVALHTRIVKVTDAYSSGDVRREVQFGEGALTLTGRLKRMMNEVVS